ncbi:MAG: hypothetical protein JO257_36150 [Deltaproteobacteria bacterium]|nr:hypothetical protein [Deltaproteobacteria bacterium]
MPAASDIDRLVEEGLDLYGKGDIDGALLRWEEVLALDPDNDQAASYVEYVRDNYELLTTSEPGIVDGADTPFGIEEEPEYEIQVLPGELPVAQAPMHMDTLDEGWFLDEAPTREASFVREAPSLPNTTLEIEAEEPPAAEESGGVNFEDATREYFGPASEFGVETTSGVSSQKTGIKKRDMGFVRAASESEPEAEAEETREFGGVNVKLRTPETPLELGKAGGTGKKPTVDEDDLIASLPSPRPAPEQRPVTTRDLPLRAPELPSTADVAASEAMTRDMPSPPAAPATRTMDLPSVAAPPTRTRDYPSPSRPPANRDRDISAVSQAEVMLSNKKTEDLEGLRRAQLSDPIVSAPTRELGLRPLAEPAKPAKEPEGTRADGTRHDLVLPFDPIDARSAQILDDVDEGAPSDEAKEDRTRRRITALFDKAIEWNGAGELDKAVAAVDLALSEDPNSALAQKLIHRNRETVQQVFQNFLGDLARTPQLARPLHELATAPISPRAAFLLSRIDGMISIDEILDVSGMPRIEAYRHLCQLYLRGILR